MHLTLTTLALASAVRVEGFSAGVTRRAASRAAPAMLVAPELEGIEVFSVVDGAPRQAQKLVGPELLSKVHISAFLTHFADFNAWEYAQRLKAVDAELAAMGVELTLVGIGTQAAGAKFAELLDLPADRIYADPTGASHRALGFSPGALPDVEIPPLVKLAAMLGGVGSPGTIEAVIRGYFGDPSADAKWVGLALQQGAAKGRFPTELPSNAFDNVGRTGLRPFELATLRLQNMLQGILVNWDALAPKDPSLALQQGGTVVYDWRGELIYRYADEGILVYTPVDEMLTAIKESMATATPPIVAGRAAGRAAGWAVGKMGDAFDGPGRS